jgi:hypothetical protein
MPLTLNSPKIEVAAATMAELVKFYNSLSGRPAIKKFETRAKGVERVNALIEAEGEPKDTAVGIADLHKTNHPVAAANKASWPSGPKTKPAPSAMAHIAKTVVAKSAPAKAKPAKKPATKAAKPAAKAPSGGRASFSVDDVITVVHKGENPKRGTAAERYDLYRSGMTVAAYIAAGGQRRDVVWDIKMGWITVKVAK